MATTIVTKNGSGAPTASDLVAGELAVDLTNGRLYTENSSAAVVELGSNPSGNITFGDNGKAIFGAGSDLQIYHDASDSVILDNGTGNLKIQANDLVLKNADGSKEYLKGTDGGSVRVRYNNTTVLETTATGVDITGSATIKAAGADASRTLSIQGTNGSSQIYQFNIVADGENSAAKFMIGSGGGAATERMRIDSSGNVGIGTSPARPLHVSTSGVIPLRLTSTGTDCQIELGNSGGTPIIGSFNDQLIFKTASTERIRIDASGNVGIATDSPDSGYKLDVAGNVVFGDGGGFDMNVDGTRWQFSLGGSEKMRIDSSGNVKIGTGSPNFPLQLDSNRADATFNANDVSTWADFKIQGDTASGNARGIYFDFDQDTENDRGAGIVGISGDAGGGVGSLGFITTSGNVSAERMRIDASGNLLVGKTSPDATLVGGEIRATGVIYSSVASSSNTDITLGAYSTSASQWQMYVGMAGTIYARSTSIASLSDARRKENIVDLETGLTEVMALRPRRFDWKNSQEGDDRQIAGFIAQEVEAVLPDLISSYKDEEVDDLKSLRMGDMLPTLVKAIQEQQATIEALEARIAALES